MTKDLLSHIPSFDGLLAPGNIDIYDRPAVKNPDGSSSTVKTILVGGEGEPYYLLPTIIDGKEYSPKEAIEYAKKTGEHLGVFGSEDAANAYDKQMHEYMGWNGPNNEWPDGNPSITYDFSGSFKGEQNREPKSK